MAKWSGCIGFSTTVETRPGVYKQTIVDKKYYGDMNRVNRRLQPTGNTVNDNITVSNELSIVADAFANDNFHAIRYVEFMGVKWKASSVEVQRPRLILTLGDKYNDGE